MTEPSMLALGLNHTTAPVEFRERLAIGADQLPEVLRRLRDAAGLTEAVILSTCNRVEVYGVGPSGMDQAIFAELARDRALPVDALQRHSFVRHDEGAARHIFRVAASLESMVLGEPQILGQVKDAYRVARRAGTLGTVLDRCLTMAFAGAKRVRSQTTLGVGGASVPSVAVDLAEDIFGNLDRARVLVLGAGEMAEQAARYLRSHGVAEIVVVNRTLENAVAMAAGIQGQAAPWGELERRLTTADIVVTGTGAPTAVVDLPLMRRVMRARRGAPVLFVDIAVPRDVEPAVAELDQVFLYNVDDLQRVVHANLSQRHEQAAQASFLVEQEVESFLRWRQRRDAAPWIARIEAEGHALEREEVERALGRLRGSTAAAIGPEVEQAMARLAHALVGKLLHRPIVRARQAGESGEHDALRLLGEMYEDLAGADGEAEAERAPSIDADDLVPPEDAGEESAR